MGFLPSLFYGLIFLLILDYLSIKLLSNFHQIPCSCEYQEAVINMKLSRTRDLSWPRTEVLGRSLNQEGRETQCLKFSAIKEIIELGLSVSRVFTHNAPEPGFCS